MRTYGKSNTTGGHILSVSLEAPAPTATPKPTPRPTPTLLAVAGSTDDNGTYFTVGSSKDQVLAVQGTPYRLSGNRWTYPSGMVNG